MEGGLKISADMKIFVKVKTGAKEEKLIPVNEKNYLASVKAEPIDGRANDDVVRLLGKYFNIPPSTIRIVHGEGAREKIIEVPLTPTALNPLDE